VVVLDDLALLVQEIFRDDVTAGHQPLREVVAGGTVTPSTTFSGFRLIRMNE
jgi:hypothetical protein